MTLTSRMSTRPFKRVQTTRVRSRIAMSARGQASLQVKSGRRLKNEESTRLVREIPTKKKSSNKSVKRVKRNTDRSTMQNYSISARIRDVKHHALHHSSNLWPRRNSSKRLICLFLRTEAHPRFAPSKYLTSKKSSRRIKCVQSCSSRSIKKTSMMNAIMKPSRNMSTRPKS